MPSEGTESGGSSDLRKYGIRSVLRYVRILLKDADFSCDVILSSPSPSPLSSPILLFVHTDIYPQALPRQRAFRPEMSGYRREMQLRELSGTGSLRKNNVNTSPVESLPLLHVPSPPPPPSCDSTVVLQHPPWRMGPSYISPNSYPASMTLRALLFAAPEPRLTRNRSAVTPLPVRNRCVHDSPRLHYAQPSLSRFGRAFLSVRTYTLGRRPQHSGGRPRHLLFQSLPKYPVIQSTAPFSILARKPSFPKPVVVRRLHIRNRSDKT